MLQTITNQVYTEVELVKDRNLAGENVQGPENMNMQPDLAIQIPSASQ